MHEFMIQDNWTASKKPAGYINFSACQVHMVGVVFGNQFYTVWKAAVCSQTAHAQLKNCP